MASPFSIFRKNQKMWLAGLTILTILSFTFLPIVIQIISGRTGAAQNPVVVKTAKYGNLTARDLHYQQERYHALLSVTQELIGATLKTEVEREKDSGRFSPEQLQQAFVNIPKIARQQAERQCGSGTPDDLINRWLLVHHGESLGIVISDEAINDYLRSVTDNYAIPSDVIAKIIFDSHMSERFVFSLFRDQLLAKKVEEMFQLSTLAYSMPPGQRWDYFTRVQRKATIEAVPVAVAGFTKEIKDPGNDKLKEFFEANKERLPRPDSPEPGFRRPHKVAIEYLRADLDKISKAVTDDQIKQFYEKNKELFDQYIKQLNQSKPSADVTKPRPPVAPDATKPGESTKKPQGEARKPGEQPLKPPAEPPTKPRSAVAPEATKQPPDPHGAPQKPVGPGEKGSRPPAENKPNNSASAVSVDSPFRLTAFQAEDKAAEKAPAAAKPETASAKPPAAAKPETAPARPESVGRPAKTPAAKLELPSVGPAKPTAPGVLPDEIKGIIRRQLMGEKLKELFGGIREPMKQFREDYAQYEMAARVAQREEKSPPPVPQKLDLAAYAKKHGLVYGQAPLEPEWQLKETEIGRSIIGRVPVYVAAFALSKFRADESTDRMVDFAYLFWKTDDVKEYVPKFDDPGVREEVLQAWRMVQARDPAQKAAKALAEETAQSHQPLKKFFANRPDIHVILPDPFTWMTIDRPLGASAATKAERSSIAGIKYPSDEFMKTVFHMKDGDVSVAMDAPQTTAYVVRLDTFTPSYEALKTLFQNTNYSEYVAVAADDEKQMHHAWLEEIKAKAGFERIRVPTQQQPEAKQGQQEPEPDQSPPLDDD